MLVHMSVTVRSFAKINLGLRIGASRDDGFHELRTVYQTIALHDVLKIEVQRGTGIEIKCKDPRVPSDESNTCYRMADRVMRVLKQRGKVLIQIEKKLPVQGGLGAASSNAVATLLGMERALKQQLSPEQHLQLAAEVGSDVPLFLVGGTVLGMGRGEQVLPLEDLPVYDCVIATPNVGVSTPKAFRDWDEQVGDERERQQQAFNRRAGDPGYIPHNERKLTANSHSGTINGFSHSVFAWLCGTTPTGVSSRAGNRAEALLLDLVRAGIENDFERVVFPENPELREVKRALERQGARYCSLSGSGSTVYGLFAAREPAEKAAAALANEGRRAHCTTTLSREQYWQQVWK